LKKKDFLKNYNGRFYKMDRLLKKSLFGVIACLPAGRRGSNATKQFIKQLIYIKARLLRFARLPTGQAGNDGNPGFSKH